MDFTKQYGSTDPKTNARWVEHQNAKFFIAPANNIAFKNKTLEMFKMNELQGGGLDKLTAKQVVDIESEIKAHTILLDWENVEDRGQTCGYSQDKAKEMLTNYEQFRSFIDAESLKIATEIKKVVDNKKKS
tara:strand:+ start:4270 stop:4662 length:393 start_codon:yes stop_codon:yes gene_type:complete